MKSGKFPKESVSLSYETPSSAIFSHFSDFRLPRAASECSPAPHGYGFVEL
jgi:hypothetical protein